MKAGREGRVWGAYGRLQRQQAAAVEEPAAAPVGRDANRALRIQRLPKAYTPAFVVIFLMGAALRLVDLTWDQNTHIHPDERFLTMLGTAVRLPSSLWQYFDPTTSPLSPYNSSYGSMVYGMLPVTMNKLLAVWFGNDNFGMFVVQGRGLSAVADLGTLLCVYLISRRLAERGFAPQIAVFLAPALYALAVLPIQISHFFTVDSFLSAFAWASVYFALRYSTGGSWAWLTASGLFLGFSLASKVTGVYMAPVVLYLVICRSLVADPDPTAVVVWLRNAGRDWRRSEKALEDAAFSVIVLGVATYIGLRIGAPYYFASANPVDPRLGAAFFSNLQSLNAYNSPNVWYPPGVQWIHKPPITFALVNLAVFGLGAPFFLAAVAGSYIVVTRLLRSPLAVLLLWTLALFLYLSVEYVKTMRYFILLYPALALFAAVGLAGVLQVVRGPFRPVVALSLVIWPLAFMSLYTKDLTRVSASQWIYTNIPSGSVIVNEEWDDPLPLQLPSTNGKTFPQSLPPPRNPGVRALMNQEHYISNGQVSLTLPDFHYDTRSKWADMQYVLAHGDYLVLSSNRGWGSMPTDPKQYPRQTQFYRDLFAGRMRYKQVAVFTSYPSLRYLGIPIDFPDQWSEEAFTVYDHPEVIIFEHVR